jgi:DNA repair exonuclease SbcCD ATPase subunit
MGAKKKPDYLLRVNLARMRELAHRGNPNAACLVCGNPHHDHEHLEQYEIDEINEGREEEHRVIKCEHTYNAFNIMLSSGFFCYIPLAPPGDPADNAYMESIST